jgi:hypothetical protein
MLCNNIVLNAMAINSWGERVYQMPHDSLSERFLLWRKKSRAVGWNLVTASCISVTTLST